MKYLANQTKIRLHQLRIRLLYDTPNFRLIPPMNFFDASKDGCPTSWLKKKNRLIQANFV